MATTSSLKKFTSQFLSRILSSNRKYTGFKYTTQMKPVMITTLICFTVAACSSISPSHQLGRSSKNTVPMAAGSITIAKQLPAVTSADHLPYYGFIPFQPSLEEEDTTLNWVEINSSTHELVVRNRGKELHRISLLSADRPSRKGRFEIQQAEEDPKWYATDEYYKVRDLPVPPEGDASRFLKGALGSHALHLSDLVVHSGPVSLPGVNEIRVPKESLEEIFEVVEAGTIVAVR